MLYIQRVINCAFACLRLVLKTTISLQHAIKTQFSYNKYSHEQSCYGKDAQYNQKGSQLFTQQRTFLQITTNQELAYSLSETPIISDGIRHFIDQGVGLL